MITEHEIEIRVRYQETDAQGHVHHANYLTWFELGRCEMLRAAGRGYEQLEAEGIILVVSEMNCKYYRPCRFGEAVRLRTTVVKSKGARICHKYQISRAGELLAEGESTIACIDRSGMVRRLPAWLTDKPTESSSSNQ